MKDQYINPAFSHMIHGADYNPEQWMHDRAIWDRDMELMTDASERRGKWYKIKFLVKKIIKNKNFIYKCIFL